MLFNSNDSTEDNKEWLGAIEVLLANIGSVLVCIYTFYFIFFTF